MQQDPSAQTALERIAVALEREIARRDTEAATKDEETRRTRWAVVFLIYLYPLAWAALSARNSSSLAYWTLDPGRFAVSLTVTATLTAAIVQAVRMGAFSVGGFVVVLSLISFAAMVSTGREDYIGFSIFYSYFGARVMVAYIRSIPALRRALNVAFTFGETAYVGRLVLGVLSLLPLIGLTPYVFYVFTHRWDVGNLAAAGVAIVGIAFWAWIARRRKLLPEPAPER
jgi:hypothetical protein